MQKDVCYKKFKSYLNVKNCNLNAEFFANGTLKKIFENSWKFLSKFLQNCTHESTETVSKFGHEL